MYPRGATLDVVAPAAAVLATGRLLHPPQCPVCAPQNHVHGMPSLSTHLLPVYCFSASASAGQGKHMRRTSNPSEPHNGPR